MRDMSTMQNPQEVMTTEEFHRLLRENVELQARERIRHKMALCDIKDRYTKNLSDVAEEERRLQADFREARTEFEDAKTTYETGVRRLAKARNDAGRSFHIAQAEESNRWTLFNNDIQSDRHNIFERYRNSGGQFLDDASELLHPEWSKKTRKGGVSDEETQEG